MQRAELANLRAVPTWTSNDWVGRKTGQKPVIRIHPTQVLLDQARAALATAKDDATSLALKKEVKLYEDRIERVREVLGEGFVTTDIPGREDPEEVLRTPAEEPYSYSWSFLKSSPDTSGTFR